MRLGRWGDDEQQRFLNAIEKFGREDNKAIASFVGSRNVNQVRHHVKTHFKAAAAASGEAGTSAAAADEVCKSSLAAVSVVALP